MLDTNFKRPRPMTPMSTTSYCEVMMILMPFDRSIDPSAGLVIADQSTKRIRAWH
jgi:hypothetical protein